VFLISYPYYRSNASLSFAAMFMFYAPNYGAAVLGVFASIITAIAQQALATLLEPYGLPFMTLPFCVVALPFIIIQGTTTIVIPVPLASMTIPEDHLKRVKTLTDGFQFLKEAIHPDSEHSHKFGRKVSRQLSDLSEALNASSSIRKCKGGDDVGKKASPSVAASRILEQQYGQLHRQRLFDCANWCCRQSPVLKEEWVIERAPVLFDTLVACYDKNMDGDLQMEEFRSALSFAGFIETEGLHFASLVFNLMDMDQSLSIDRNEFVVFCLVSRALLGIRHKIAKFFDFVDQNRDSVIDFQEIDAALDYLGRPVLTDDDRETLVAVTGIQSEDDGIDAVELINFVTVAKIKALVNAYRYASDTEHSDW